MTDPFARDGRLWSAIYGCWMGKNCGGTLGAPLEKGFGAVEPFDIWWYPKLQEGGIPNDDLEMQLLWLKASEEVGPQLTAQHLAQYWLDHIGYNWDEYGFSKHNLRLGLRPPISGYYNNWFRDCMGCPIRSEIWACIAPGHPRIAARYAYEDAICDHAGGESVHGELFNVAIESAAFIVDDPRTLIAIGLSYVAPHTQTYKAIQAALDAKDAGVDWLEARRRVLTATPHKIAQYSPLNMAFQVIGWLWGNDFGDAICKAVNCGYDTDCTGATLGSYLGIILGKNGLPEKWVQPLGESIATNESWGGLRNASTGRNPIPTHLTELTDRTIAVSQKVLAFHGITGDPLANVRVEDLYADDSIRTMVSQPATALKFDLDAIRLSVDYLDTPAAIPGEMKSLVVRLSNDRPDPLQATLKWSVPDGFVAPMPQSVAVAYGATIEVNCTIGVPEDARQLQECNRLDLVVDVPQRPAMQSAVVVLISGWKMQVSQVYAAQEDDPQTLLDMPFPPERDAGDVQWQTRWAHDNVIPIDDLMQSSSSPSVVYVRTFVHCDRSFAGKVAVGFTGPTKLWFNGAIAGSVARYRAIRPGSDAGYDGEALPAGEVAYQAGWNEILIKFVRTPNAPLPFAAHLILSEGKLADGLIGIVRNRFPSDED